MATEPDTDRLAGRFPLPKNWSWPPVLLAVLLPLVLHASRLVWKSNLRGRARPPGPKGLPILGNLLQILNARTKPWLMYLDLSRQYGDLVYVNVLGQSILVLNSLESIHDLLEKRGSIHGDKAVPPSIELMRMDWSFGFMNYGPTWRAYRRTFHQYYNKTQIPKYGPVLEQQVAIFLRRLLSEPQHFLEHAKYLFGAIIIQISYGFDKAEDIKSLTDAAEVITEAFSDCANPGHFLVDVFPILRFVPHWFPGAAWKRRLIGVGNVSQDVFQRPFDDAWEQTKNGVQGEAQHVVAGIIENLPPKDHPDYAQLERQGRGAALIAYIAGADTTVSSAHALFIALANYPECQRKAQEELDGTIGTERLPKAADLPHLPYVRALVKELSRWFSVTPLAAPHVSSQDDIYKGYLIPKGTVIMGNTWAIMHDPDVFEDPLEFKPERYLMLDPVTKQSKINPDVLDPESAAFGFGRRICPGRHLSNESLTLMAASLLAVFNVNAPTDPVTGQPIKVQLETGSGVISSPAPFKVNIVPRSPRHAALVSHEG
ncbi:cytochrome P450 [Coprinopsis sp. MPI-PUGE-AT-0042]|nr:cytochrome P450 [Coprinopsis sp. MPI-PUGE-AT-0042]